jgi:hypothetical protein
MLVGVGEAACGARMLVALVWPRAVTYGCRGRCDGRDGKSGSGEEERACERCCKKQS